MNTTIEISMYPLREDYEKQILQFLEYLHEVDQMEIKVNAMSTQVVGDFDLAFDAIQSSIKKVYENGIKASFVLKVLEGKLDLNYQYGN
ncbi:MAG: YkoF family thiamine/hydroxymethylpyrimidine-binding protein [Bacteroidota bacterium]